MNVSIDRRDILVPQLTVVAQFNGPQVQVTNDKCC